MKICNKCNQTYSDENLNFCLEDGNPLTSVTSPNIDDQETIVMDSAAETEVYPKAETQNAWRSNPRTNPQTNRKSIPIEPTPINAININSSPPSNSKTWIWALVVLASVVMLCGAGSLIGLAIVGSYVEEDSDNPTDQKPPITQSSPEINNSSTKNGKLINSTNFTNMKFKSNEFITVDNSYDGLKLTTRNNYYYVFAFDGFPTDNATTKITVTNDDAEYTKFGYGLVVQGDPKKILSNDYAFVIRSDKGQYRIVKHKDLKESVVHNWKTSSAINKGSESNDLEVRISGDEMKFYINDTFIKTVKDTTGYEGGVAGVYTSDDVPITFTNLELRNNN